MSRLPRMSHYATHPGHHSFDGSVNVDVADATAESIGDARIRNYMLPTISALFGKYSNEESDYIQAAFTSSAQTKIKNIPDHVDPLFVWRRRGERIHAMRQKRDGIDSGSSQLGGWRYSDWRPSSAKPSRSLSSSLLASQERKPPARRSRSAMHNREHATTQRLPPVGRVTDSAADSDSGDDWIPSVTASEAVEDTRHVMLHQRVTQSRAPSSNKQRPKSQAGVRSGMLARGLQLMLQHYLPEPCTVKMNSHGFVVVRVTVSSQDSAAELRSWMDDFMASNEFVDYFQLQKVEPFWHFSTGDATYYYVLRPPWVTQDTPSLPFAAGTRDHSTVQQVREVNGSTLAVPPVHHEPYSADTGNEEIPVLDVRRELQRAAIAKTKMGRRVSRMLLQGSSLDGEIVADLLQELVSIEPYKSQGWRLLGYPQTRQQAAVLDARGIPVKAIPATQAQTRD